MVVNPASGLWGACESAQLVALLSYLHHSPFVVMLAETDATGDRDET